MKKYIFILIVIVLLVSFGWWWNTKEAPFVHPFPVLSSDAVSSWNYTGAYTGKKEFEDKAFSEIERLKGLRGSKDYTDYGIYVSIANQYDLMGDGKMAYEYLGKALVIDPTNTGLAWHNLAGVMESVGAYESAKEAHKRAYKAQAIPFYEASLIDFLNKRFPEEAKEYVK
jgi:tetratricopeptide (TPR) repeat protein